MTIVSDMAIVVLLVSQCFTLFLRKQAGRDERGNFIFMRSKTNAFAAAWVVWVLIWLVGLNNQNLSSSNLEGIVWLVFGLASLVDVTSMFYLQKKM